MNNSIFGINSEIDKLRESDPIIQEIQSKIEKSKSSTAKVPYTSEENVVLRYTFSIVLNTFLECNSIASPKYWDR
jgi:hypothetical protein